MPTKEVETVHEAVGTFDDVDSLQAAMDDLQTCGFMRQEISVLADDDVIKHKRGSTYERTEDAADDPSAPRTTFTPNETIGEAEGIAIAIPLYIMAVIASGFMIASGSSVIAAVAAGIFAGITGAALGSIFAMRINKHHKQYIQNQIDRGGLLLWVHLRSVKLEKKAMRVLRKNDGHDVHVHEIPLY